MPNGYMLNYVILITHSSNLYLMWDFIHTCALNSRKDYKTITNQLQDINPL